MHECMKMPMTLVSYTVNDVLVDAVSAHLTHGWTTLHIFYSTGLRSGLFGSSNLGVFAFSVKYDTIF